MLGEYVIGHNPIYGKTISEPIRRSSIQRLVINAVESTVSMKERSEKPTTPQALYKL